MRLEVRATTVATAEQAMWLEVRATTVATAEQAMRLEVRATTVAIAEQAMRLEVRATTVAIVEQAMWPEMRATAATVVRVTWAEVPATVIVEQPTQASLPIMAIAAQLRQTMLEITRRVRAMGTASTDARSEAKIVVRIAEVSARGLPLGSRVVRRPVSNSRRTVSKSDIRTA
jgi:hypothetical protein